jgi:hypothetical protein
MRLQDLDPTARGALFRVDTRNSGAAGCYAMEQDWRLTMGSRTPGSRRRMVQQQPVALLDKRGAQAIC